MDGVEKAFNVCNTEADAPDQIYPVRGQSSKMVTAIKSVSRTCDHEKEIPFRKKMKDTHAADYEWVLRPLGVLMRVVSLGHVCLT